ncbi:MAG: GLPGLI family protein [Chryseobacterium sp.]|uniref:GLPGLI family protein n=1 Tax=Chryseobacterium sp. TaxID=1871047 RepID=UPI0025BA6D46|nr:GLPGLI family protein [Chryseobacterium sp.]MCJ7932655.1 GLPGLI family protein [Chryseobacterium sp.]
MQKLLTLVAAFVLLNLSAQTNRFIYTLEYRADPSQDYRQELMVLDINKKNVKFYDKKFLEYDSLNVAAKKTNGLKSRTSTSTDQLIVRAVNSNTNFWYRDFFDYFVVKTENQLNWKLSPETMVYNEYKLQKAECDFGGRHWTAWFSNDVQIPEGPYKFRGLPGLIFIIQDQDSDFVYKLVKNTKLPDTYDTTDFLENHYDKKPIPISLEKYNKYIIDIYNNPTRVFLNNVKDGKQVNFGKDNVQSLEELNKKKMMMQKMIKERYIPVEKNNAPKF